MAGSSISGLRAMRRRCGATSRRRRRRLPKRCSQEVYPQSADGLKARRTEFFAIRHENFKKPVDTSALAFYTPARRPDGGIGRRAGFRYLCREAWRFESSSGHHSLLSVVFASLFSCFCLTFPDPRGVRQLECQFVPPAPACGSLYRPAACDFTVTGVAILRAATIVNWPLVQGFNAISETSINLTGRRSLDIS